MLKGILILLIFQFLGGCINKIFSTFIPSPIIGMSLLLVFLLLKKEVFQSLDFTVNFFLKYLPIFILPSAVGIITQSEVISKEFFSIFISLSIGTILSLIVSSKMMDYFMDKSSKI